MRQIPPLNYLQAFEAAARLGSFTEAARELNCTQQAISQRIRGLEAIYGRPLFVRMANGVQPTEAAQLHMTAIGGALDSLQSLARDFTASNRQNRVLVSLPVTFATIWVASRIAAFVNRYPTIDVRLNGTVWNDPNAEVADLLIELFETSEVPAGAIELTVDRAHVVCAPAVAAQMNGSAPRRFFENQPLITLLSRYDFWSLWQREAGGTSIGNGAKIEVDAAVTGLEIARRGVGVAIGLDSQIASYLRSGDLVRPLADHISIELKHVVLPIEGKRLSRPASAFLAFLVEHRQLMNTAP